MADQLATPEDLASLLERDDLLMHKATLLVECATAVVQEAAGQRIIQATSTGHVLMGTTDLWLPLPQIPVTAVASVEIDGEAITDHKRFGSQLWRSAGWATCSYEPSTVEVTYTHGYATGHQKLQFARSAVLGLCRDYGNPEGATRVEIDDYAAVYAAMSARVEAAPELRRALQRAYGRKAGLVKMG